MKKIMTLLFASLFVITGLSIAPQSFAETQATYSFSDFTAYSPDDDTEEEWIYDQEDH